MNPQGADLLAQLRDIHSAPVEPWWPPAPGWWILVVLLALGVFLAVRKLQDHFRLRRRRQRLAGYVDAIEAAVDPDSAPQAFLAAINRIFKLVAIEAFPEAQCAGMQGEEWVAFLQRNLPQSPHLEQLLILADGPYRASAQFEPAALTGLVRQWIRDHG